MVEKPQTSEPSYVPERVVIADPSPLTTQNLLREIANARELVTSELRVRDARLDGMDKALEIAQAFPTEIDKAIANVKAFYDEKIGSQATYFNDKIAAVVTLKSEHFKGIATQFAERDARHEQTSKDRQLAIDAAFQAAKEAGQEQIRSRDQAIAKSESATTKQIDALHTLLITTTKGSDDKIDDIKTRLTAIESRTTVTKEVVGDSRTMTFAVIGAIVGAAGIVFGLIAMLRAGAGT